MQVRILVCVVILIAAFLSTSFSASAQKKVSFGGKAGFGLGIFQAKGSQISKASTSIGFGGGLYANYHVNDRLAFQAELLVLQHKGSSIADLFIYDEVREIKGVTIPVDVRVRIYGDLDMTYLNLPLLVRYDYIHRDQYACYMLGGPSVAVALQNKVSGNYEVFVKKIPFQDIEPALADNGIDENTELIVEKGDIQPGTIDFNTWDYGFTVGGGTRVDIGPGELVVELRYSMNFNDQDRSGDALYTGSFMTMFGFEF